MKESKLLRLKTGPSRIFATLKAAETNLIAHFGNVKNHIILAALFIAALMFNEQPEIVALERLINEVGFYFIFVYIPLLFIIASVARTYRTRQSRENVGAD